MSETLTPGFCTYLREKAALCVERDPLLALFDRDTVAQQIADTYLAETVPGTRTPMGYAAWLPGAIVRRRAMANA